MTGPAAGSYIKPTPNTKPLSSLGSLCPWRNKPKVLIKIDNHKGVTIDGPNKG